MWVLMACPYSLSRPGGVQGQALGLARSLRTLGHTVTVVAPHDGYQPGTFLAESSCGHVSLSSRERGRDILREVNSSGCDGTFVVGPSMRIPANGSVSPIAVSPAAVVRVVQLLRRRSPDVVHLHEPLAPMINYAFLCSANIPIVGTFHRSGRGVWHSLLRPAARWATDKLSVRCAVSPAAAETSGSNEVEVLFNGVEVERFSEAKPWLTDSPTVMFLGRHEKRKGLELLLRAFAAIPDPAVLWIGGEGPETARLRHKFPATSRLKWLGTLSEVEMTRRLRGADVLCAPSLFGESFGVVLLEAMSARCLIVASALDGHRSAVGGHAQLFPVGDQGALTSALTEALVIARSNNARRTSVLEGAFTYANGLSMAHLAERYTDIYKRIVGDERQTANDWAETRCPTWPRSPSTWPSKSNQTFSGGSS
jgi:phosphatidylinositol alpha-mannosyltransferase